MIKQQQHNNIVVFARSMNNNKGRGTASVRQWVKGFF